MVEIDDELLGFFIEEATDTLASFERSLLDLEQELKPESCNALFRAAHNLKGASRSVGLDAFGEFIHHVEDVISQVISGKVQLSPPVMSTLLRCHGELSNWTDQLKTNRAFNPDVSGLLNLLAEILAGPTSESPELANTAQEESAAVSELSELDLIFLKAKDEYEKASGQKPVAEHISPTPTPTESTKQPLESVVTGKEAAALNGKNIGKSDETIRISAAKLDSLIQLIGELTIHQGIVTEGRKTGTIDSRASQHAIQLSAKITKELHSRALSLRMHAVASLFQRLERVARDVARTQMKDIRVELIGTDVELDKAIIEKLADPLTHMVRNAIDHGMESPEERQTRGKPKTGLLRLKASQQANGVHISISDDGRGLQRRKILEKAEQNKIISAGVNLTDKQVWNLIFEPGFSTADQVTEISGRGVGMDVVRSSVQSLKGSIEIDSQTGKGSEFLIVLPTTLSILDALVIKLNSVRYAVPMQDLAEIIDLANYPLESSNNSTKIISLRGAVIPVEELSGYISSHDHPKVSDATTTTGCPALIVKSGGRPVAFKIDQVLTQQQVVVRPLAEHLQKASAFSGSTILGDGEPSIILSLPYLAQEFLAGLVEEV